MTLEEKVDVLFDLVEDLISELEEIDYANGSERFVEHLRQRATKARWAPLDRQESDDKPT